MSDTIQRVQEWHRRACPHPDQGALNVQFGCHLEEILEMFDAVEFTGEDDSTRIEAGLALMSLSHRLKTQQTGVVIVDREGLLDSLADQVVTAVGAGYRAGMQTDAALVEVDRSNWSKFNEQGQPIFDAHGKVKKGPGYTAPDLEGLY